MVGENPTSPNAIPARSSSAGVTNGVQRRPSKSVLKPLPEDSWISPSHKRKSLPQMSPRPLTTSPTTTPLPPPAPLAETTNTANVARTNGSVRRRHSKKSSAPENMVSHSSPSSSKRPPRQTPSHTPHDPESWSPANEKILLGPYDYLFSHPGKDIRSSLITAFDALLHVPPASLATITSVVGMLHTSSLLIDDVQDSSTLRRGVPVAHSIFGTAQTINSANYVYFLALAQLATLPNQSAVMDIFTTELLNLHRGQGMDLYWRDTLTCPTEDEYLEMVQNKTGGLFRLAVKLMAAESSRKLDPRLSLTDLLLPLTNLIGLIFQIADDYQNLRSPAYTSNKGLCEDLTEGKFSFPIIHAVRSDPANLQLVNILRQKTRDDEVKRYAVRYMEARASFAYTRRVIADLKAKAAHLLTRLGPDADGVRVILDAIVVE
jgi:geranylgeranyl diphosphate synthase, type III